MKSTQGFEQFFKDVGELLQYVRNVHFMLRATPNADIEALLIRLETGTVADLDPELGKFWDDFNEGVRVNNQLRATLDAVEETLARQRRHDVETQARKDNS